ncbi:response regulator transcription factor [Shewanella sp. D64]|uniref:response regulator transcription factor n=1 Tax=unclassified Shewanella TaxID=196818 RepID=UPI0022BA2E0C|nr:MULTISPECIES: response regulator transcription factor [unclassified Shewanella]MEC4727146.1 response regulator transcription factor [Shewanella sp. D64]MEC4739237.1 response regulator transcription factor [Shewanella sp. E94]WBJ95577.1 response regulator transcription factor [Shewanella sp. MTB7]
MIVLLIEDDLDLTHTLVDYFELMGIQCDHANNGQSGYQLAKDNIYKTIILDINIPRMDGYSVCKRLRSEGVDTPIIMLTSKASINDKLLGFDSGTDDYLVKPFAMEELLARVNVLSKRRSGQSQMICIKNLIINKTLKKVIVDDNEISMPPIEYKILECISLFSNQLVSKQYIASYIWNDDIPKTDALKVHIYNLRKILFNSKCLPQIKTIKGYGIFLRVEDEN